MPKKRRGSSGAYKLKLYMGDRKCKICEGYNPDVSYPTHGKVEHYHLKCKE